MRAFAKANEFLKPFSVPLEYLTMRDLTLRHLTLKLSKKRLIQRPHNEPRPNIDYLITFK